jgi:hypothetical protein
VILLAVPCSEVDDVVERSRLVAEKIGRIHQKSRDGGGVDHARGAGANISDKVRSPHDFGAVGGRKVNVVRK